MHSPREKFICSGENILHHHPAEIPALPEQTSKYSNEHLVRTPNQQYVHFFFLFRYPSLLEDILAFQDRMAYQECREFLAPQGHKDNKEKMELRGRDLEAWRGGEGKKGNKRSRGNNGAPRMKGFKKYDCNVGCLGSRCFRNCWRWPIYIISSVDKTKLSCNTPHRLSITVTKLPSLNIKGHGCLFLLHFAN